MTQAVVSVVRGRRVLLKIVAGCDGMKATEVARRLRAGSVTDPEEAYRIAVECAFGCPDDIVVLSPDAAIYRPMDGGPEDLPARYRDTFDLRRFNPRWENGTADRVRVVRLPCAPRRARRAA